MSRTLYPKRTTFLVLILLFLVALVGGTSFASEGSEAASILGLQVLNTDKGVVLTYKVTIKDVRSKQLRNARIEYQKAISDMKLKRKIISSGEAIQEKERTRTSWNTVESDRQITYQIAMDDDHLFLRTVEDKKDEVVILYDRKANITVSRARDIISPKEVGLVVIDAGFQIGKLPCGLIPGIAGRFLSPVYHPDISTRRSTTNGIRVQAMSPLFPESLADDNFTLVEGMPVENSSLLLQTDAKGNNFVRRIDISEKGKELENWSFDSPSSFSCGVLPQRIAHYQFMGKPIAPFTANHHEEVMEPNVLQVAELQKVEVGCPDKYKILDAWLKDGDGIRDNRLTPPISYAYTFKEGTFNEQAKWALSDVTDGKGSNRKEIRKRSNAGVAVVVSVIVAAVALFTIILIYIKRGNRRT